MDIVRMRSEGEPRGAESPSRRGLCFYVDDRAAEDSSESAGSFRGAAEPGDVLAPFGLGSCYFNGTGEMMAPLEIVLGCREAVEHGAADVRNGAGAINGPGGGASTIRSPRTSAGAAAVSAVLRNDIDSPEAARARSWAEF